MNHSTSYSIDRQLEKTKNVIGHASFEDQIRNNIQRQTIKEFCKIQMNDWAAHR